MFNIVPIIINGHIGLINTVFLNSNVLLPLWVWIIIAMMTTTMLFKMYDMSKEFWYWIDRFIKGWV